ncbi:MAG: serine protease [Myxococcales bacterium]|nr:serine protease [Myxococcales bacterium]
MGRYVACALGLCAFGAIARAEEPSPQQKIAITSKPSVVRVWGAYIATYDLAGTHVQEAIGGSGTGFFITPDGYIATNAHVVAEIHGGEDKAKEALYKMLLAELDHKYAAELARMSEDQIQRLLRSIKVVELKKWAYVVLPNGDKLDYEIKQYGKPGSGRDAALIKVKTENAPTLSIGDSTKSQVEDHIVVIGYPGVADFKDLLDEKSQLQASVTDGAISSLKRAASGEQILQISAPITHGNSGGPAIDQRGNVIGLATFGNEGAIQGFNFLVASATLMQLVKDEKIEPKQGETNKAWNEGLDHFWSDEYSDAVAKFEEVETLFPAHSEAPGLIRMSHQAQKEGKEKKSSNDGLIAGLVIGGFVIVGGGGFMLSRRGKTAARPGQMPGATPGQMPPYMGQSPPQPQMYGRVQPSPQGAPAPIAKTVAVQQNAAASGGIAPTAFGTISIGSLTCTRGALYGQRFALTPGGVIIGRQPGVAHVLINDHRASGKHVWIGMENGRLVAIDQGTTNGTFVNDVMRGRITRAELRDGDIIIVSEPDCLSLQIKLG